MTWSSVSSDLFVLKDKDNPVWSAGGTLLARATAMGVILVDTDGRERVRLIAWEDGWAAVTAEGAWHGRTPPGRLLARDGTAPPADAGAVMAALRSALPQVATTPGQAPADAPPRQRTKPQPKPRPPTPPEPGPAEDF